MKNIISIITVFILTITAQAQVYKMNAFYGFVHDSRYNTMYALNNDLETKLPSTRGDVVLTIDTLSRVLSLNDVGSGKITKYFIKKKEILGKDSELYLVNYRGKDVTFTIFQNTLNEVQVLCIWINDFKEYQGWQSVVIE